MWTSERSGTRLAGRLALACAVFAGAAIVSLTAAGAARAQGDAGGGYMGVQLQDLDEGLRESYGYRGPGGVLIADVVDGGPADQAGVKSGDIVIRFAGNTMTSASVLSSAVRGRQPGERVAFSVWRDGREAPLRVELGERREGTVERRIVRGYGQEAPEAPRPPKAAKAPEAPKHMELRWQEGDSARDMVIPMPDMEELQRHIEIATAPPRLGVELQDLDEELGAYFERPDGRGVLVTRVLKDTPAARAGFKAGDVVIGIGGKDVDDADELRRELADREAGAVQVTVLRKGQRQALTAQLEGRAAPHAMSMRGGEPRVIVRRYGGEAPEAMGGDVRREMDDLRQQMQDLKREMETMRSQMPKKSSRR